MLCKVEWQTLRLTRAGLIRYSVFRQDGPEPYGIAVRSAVQAAQCGCVSASRKRAVEWCRRLARGHVRPCHLQELLSEWLCE